MTPSAVTVHGLLEGMPGTVWVWVRPVAVGTAVACAGIAVWLLGARDRGARRARLLFGGGVAAARRLPGRAGRAPSWPVKRDGGDDTGHRTPVTAGPSVAREDGDGSGTGGFEGSRLWASRNEAGIPAIGAGSGAAGAGLGGYRIGAWAPLWWCVQPWPRAGGLLRRAGRRGAWCLLAATVAAVLGDSVLPLLFGLAVLPVVWRAAKAGEVRQEREQRADEVITLCGALAGEVRAGRHAGEALVAVARDFDGLAAARSAVLAAARFGGDVPRALSGAAREPGAEGLLGLAACWRVAVDGGAGLAAGLERLEAALCAGRSQRAELHAQLAGARSTAVLLAVLPALGLLLGTALGADPLHVLLHSGAGLGCLLVGAALEGVGLWWALHIVRNGEGT